MNPTTGNQITHYDNQRCRISDIVVTLGSGVDGLARKIGRSYTWNGTLASVSSYDSSNVVLDEIKYEYDANRKLAKLYQSHNGSVNTSTTPWCRKTRRISGFLFWCQRRLAGLRPNPASRGSRCFQQEFPFRRPVSTVRRKVNSSVERLAVASLLPSVFRPD